MRLLGIDYGQRRIGLAISEGIFAAPLGQVKDLDNVIRLVKLHQIEKVVIGQPNPANPKVKLFGERLGELAAVPVEYFDEAGSTVEARGKMIESGTSAKARRQKIDQNAATVILQGYIDSQHLGVPL